MTYTSLAYNLKSEIHEDYVRLIEMGDEYLYMIDRLLDYVEDLPFPKGSQAATDARKLLEEAKQLLDK
jgi:hypothetical protein